MSINDILASLSIEEKIGLIHGDSLFTNAGVPRLGIPKLKLSDGPFGVRAEQRLDKFEDEERDDDASVYMPCLASLAETWNPSLARLYGQVLGSMARDRGKHVILAPGVNIVRVPLAGRNFEYFGEDPLQVARMAVPYIRGLQENGVAACVKHLACNNQETERESVSVELSERALRDIYLPAFHAAVVEGGAMCVMSGYNKFRGLWCAENEYLLSKILREEWGFSGALISDWNGCHSTVASIKAGLDLEMGTVGKAFDEYYLAKPLKLAIERGEVDMAALDLAAAHMLGLAERLGLIGEAQRPPLYITSEERTSVAREIAEEAVVLLKNEGGILPLKAASIKSIAVIGDNATRLQAGNGGSPAIKALYEVSPLEGLKEVFGASVEIKYAQGYRAGTIDSYHRATDLDQVDEKLRQEAVELARSCDAAILVCGLNKTAGLDCEAFDRQSAALPFGQDELISAVLEVNPNAILVLVTGGPIAPCPWIDSVKALVRVGYLGMEGGRALARVLAGLRSPSGKLAVTWSKSLQDSPAIALGDYPGSGGVVRYREGPFVGYRWFDSRDIEPLFPFGYGLSYSRFEYKDLRVPDEVDPASGEFEIEFELANAGNFDAEEVAQAYVRTPGGDAPERELVGFVKVKLKAGEKRRCSVVVRVAELARWEEAEKKRIVRRGEYRLSVGASSRDIRLRGSFELP